MDKQLLPSKMIVKKVFANLILILVLGMMVPSCYYDKEETLYPFLKCDTTNVTYSQTIVPILAANCLSCHTTGSSQSLVVLDTYAGIQVVAANGKLIPAIDHTGPFQMPKGGSMLPDCTIEKIKKWVANGAPNN